MRLACRAQIVWSRLQDHGKASATASLGLITLWDVEGGLPQIDKYLYSRDHHVVAGGLQLHGLSHEAKPQYHCGSLASICCLELLLLCSRIGPGEQCVAVLVFVLGADLKNPMVAPGSLLGCC